MKIARFRFLLPWVVVGLMGLNPAHARRTKPVPTQKQIEAVSGRVVQVSDGDTVTVLENLPDGSKRQIKVRLDGIDAPEKKQPFGEVCRKKLADQVAGQIVQVQVRKLDRYGRSLGSIFLPAESGAGTSDINLKQVEEGCAWFYRQYAHEHSEKVQRAFENAESQARREKRGLWKDPDPMPPWTFRKKGRRGANRKKKREFSSALDFEALKDSVPS